MVSAIRSVLVNGPHTADLGGRASTTDMGKAIASAITSGAQTPAARHGDSP